MEYLIYIGVFILGFLIGWFLKRRKINIPDGIIGVDQRDGEKDFYDFLFLIPIDEVPKKKYLMVEVQTKE